MKVSTILSLLGLLSTGIAAPSHSEERDVNIYLHEPASDHVETTIGGPLRPGVYIISSPALDRNLAIGRGVYEDHSLRPKPVKTVPLDNHSQIQWEVEPLDDRRYRLSVGPNNLAAPVTAIDRRLFAILAGGPRPGEWIIEYQEAHGAYTIVSADQNSPGLGWIASPELDEQVSVRPLIITPSWPPRYQEAALFTFRPIFNDAMASTTKAGLNIEVTVEDL